MKKHLIFIPLITLLIASCELDESPVTQIEKSALFSSEEGLQVYSISFYDMLPNATDQAIVEQSLVDYGATNTLSGRVVFAECV